MVLVVSFWFSSSVSAVQTVPYKLNFQGRLTNVSGTTLSGSYDMQLRLHTAVTGGTFVWGETRTAANGNAVTVTNGLFSVLIGEGTAVAGSSATLQAAVTANPALYLEVTVGAETLSPRSQFGSSAYSVNSDMLDGLDSAAFGQLSGANSWTSAQTVNAASANAFQAKNGATNLFNVDTTNSIITVGTTDTTGAVLVLDVKSDSGDPTGASAVAGAMYYNSDAGKFRCYQASAWADCITPAGGATLQTAYNGSGAPATITTTAAKGVSIVAGAAPTEDIFTISNAGQGVTTADVDGLAVNYVGGAAAVEGAGIRIDSTPGGTTGGTWSGLRIVANPTGASSGVTEYGIKLEGPTAQGAGAETGIYIGSGWDVGLAIASGGIQLAAQDDPTAPASGQLQMYAKSIAGRMMPKWIGPSGVDTPAQAGFGFNRISMLNPSGLATAAATTVFQPWGVTVTNSASTYLNPALAATNLKTSVRRARLTSVANSATTVVYSYSANPMAWRGNAAGVGGFFFTTRFGFGATATTNRAFIGLSGLAVAPTNIDPTTSTTYDKLGIGINAGTGNLKWVNNISGTAPATADLGAGFPVDTTSLYELVIYSQPNGSSITYRVKNLSTGAVTSDTTVSSNIPANTTFMSPLMWMAPNASAAIQLESAGWYLESDN